MSWLDDIRAALGSAQAPLRQLQPAAQAFTQNVTVPAAQAGGAALGVAGDVLDTPGSVARGVGTTLGQLIKRDPNAIQSAQRTFSGILDPSQRISGTEVNQNAGIGSNPIAGAITGIATDPLAMGALAKFGSSGTSALGRTLQRGGAESVGAAGESVAPQVLRGQGLSTYTTGPNGMSTIDRTAAEASGRTVSRFGPNGAQTFAEGSTPLSTAEQWTGVRNSLPGASSTIAPPSPTTPSSNVADMLGLRRQFTALKDVGTDLAGNPTGRAIGGANALEPGQTAVQRLEQIRHGGLQSLENIGGGQTLGEYRIPERTATFPQGADIGTARHELSHGLYDIANRTGQTSQLPLIPRASLAGQNSSSPLLQGLGLMGEETAAHGAGAGRGALQQTRGMMNFLNNPVQGYADQLSNISPLAGSIYGSSAIPRLGMAGYGAGVAGAATGSGALLDALGGR